MIQPIADSFSDKNLLGLFRITDKSIQIKSAGNTQTSDLNEVSNISRELFNSKLNLSLSEAKVSSLGINFDLVFSSNSSEKLKANGYYKNEEKSLGVSLNYVFQKEVIVNGEVKTQTFEAIIDLKANVTKNISSNPREKKEDVINFVQRVVSEVLTTTNSDTKILKGFSLDKEELNDILALDDEQIAANMKSIVDLAMIVAMHKKSVSVNGDMNDKNLNYTKDESAANNILTIDEFKLTIKPVDQLNIQEGKNG